MITESIPPRFHPCDDDPLLFIAVIRLFGEMGSATPQEGCAAGACPLPPDWIIHPRFMTDARSKEGGVVVISARKRKTDETIIVPRRCIEDRFKYAQELIHPFLSLLCSQTEL